MSPKPFVYRMAVRFADVDHAGIVYYPVFFHYFHMAVEAFFRDRMGARSYVDLLDNRGVGFPAVRTECSYIAPLKFGDTIDIEMTVARLGAKSATFSYRVYRAADDKYKEAMQCAEGSTTCAVVELSKFRAIVIPDDLRPLFEQIAASASTEVSQ